MGYDFSCNDKSFHWSNGNWKRLLDMIKRSEADLPLEELRAQCGVIPPDTAEDIAAAVGQLLEKGMLPNMDVGRDIGLRHLLSGEKGVDLQENLMMLIFPWTEKPIFIYENDPRWNGLFFIRMFEFITFLVESVRENKDIHVS